MLIIEHAKKEVSLGLRPISKNCRKDFPNQYFEFHHILPKSLYPLWKSKRSNIIPLTAREHFFCHKLLIKIYPTKEMFFALYALCNADRWNRHTDFKISSREYEKLRVEICKHQKELAKNRIITDETRKKMLESRKKYFASLTIQEKQEISRRCSFFQKLNYKNESVEHKARRIANWTPEKRKAHGQKLKNSEAKKLGQERRSKELAEKRLQKRLEWEKGREARKLRGIEKSRETKNNWSEAKKREVSNNRSKAVKLRWQNMTKEEKESFSRKDSLAHMGEKNGMFGKHSFNSKRIMCIETQEVFESLRDCSIKLNISQKALIRCMKERNGCLLSKKTKLDLHFVYI